MPPTTAPGIEPKPPITAAVKPLMTMSPIVEDRNTTGAASEDGHHEREHEGQAERPLRRPRDERGHHQHLPLREVQRARGVVDDDERERHQRVDRAGRQTRHDDMNDGRRAHRSSPYTARAVSREIRPSRSSAATTSRGRSRGSPYPPPPPAHCRKIVPRGIATTS